MSNGVTHPTGRVKFPLFLRGAKVANRRIGLGCLATNTPRNSQAIRKESHPAIFRIAPSGCGAQDAHTRVAAAAKPAGFAVGTTLPGRHEAILKGFRIASQSPRIDIEKAKRVDRLKGEMPRKENCS